MAGQPGLPVPAGELPRLDRLRQGVRRRGRPRVGRQDARRPDRRGRLRVAQGWADRSRVAIYGGSYGGYAALVGAAFTPDVFCCAVDIVGPSNLKTLLETIPPYWAPMIAQLYRRVGNPETDAEFLWSRSPLSRAARHPDPAADRAGRQRPAGQAGRVRADRRRADRGRDRPRVPAVPRRGPRVRQAGEPDQVLHGGRAVPRQVPRRPVRGVGPDGCASGTEVAVPLAQSCGPDQRATRPDLAARPV